MRRLLTFLTALVLLLGSLAIGVLAADLPFWRRAMQLPLAADDVYLPVATIGGDAPATAALPAAPARQSTRRHWNTPSARRATPDRAPC